MRSLKAPPVRRRCFIMKNTPENTGEILDRGISGYHQYILTDPIHLCFVSRNLCDMLGYEKNELLSESEDLYSAIVHPDDKKLYTAFEQTMSQDTSAPLMSNTQHVYAGYTYGKNDLVETCQDFDASRGFFA